MLSMTRGFWKRNALYYANADDESQQQDLIPKEVGIRNASETATSWIRAADIRKTASENSVALRESADTSRVVTIQQTSQRLQSAGLV